MMIGLLAGILWALDTVILSKALAPFELLMIAPIVAAAIHDTCSFLDLSLFHTFKKQLRILLRAFRSKNARWIVLAALLGGPIGMSAYVSAIYFMGPAYTAAFSSLYPAFGLILSYFVFHEPISKKQLFGIAISLFGVFMMSFGSTQEMISLPVGMLCALLCIVCWGGEGVLVQFGMKDGQIGSDHALWMRQGISSLTYLIVIMNLISGWDLAGQMISISSFLWIVLAALAGTSSYLCYYHALHHIGTSKAMPLNITYVAWAIIFSFFILHTVPSMAEIGFGSLVLIGAVMASS